VSAPAVKRVAYLLDAPTFGNAAFVREPVIALAKRGVEVDVYRPNSEKFPEEPVEGLPVRSVDFDPNSMRSAFRQLMRARSRGYSMYIGGPPRSLILAALMGKLTRKPVGGLIELLYDEKRIPPGRFRSLMLWAHRQCAFTIMTDRARVAPMEGFASFSPGHKFLEIPGCPSGELDRSEAAAIRAAVRREWGVPEDAFVLLYMGVFNDRSPLEYLLSAVPNLPPNTYLVINTNATTCGATFGALCKLAAEKLSIRVIFNPRPYTKIHEVLFASDLGLAFYDGPMNLNARYLGKGSNKLCMYLRAGLPSLVTRGICVDWVEEHGAGAALTDREEFLPAVRDIQANYAAYSARALETYRKVVKLENYLPEFEQTLLGLMGERA
jgi:hypothetical protein